MPAFDTRPARGCRNPESEMGWRTATNLIWAVLRVQYWILKSQPRYASWRIYESYWIIGRVFFQAEELRDSSQI